MRFLPLPLLLLCLIGCSDYTLKPGGVDNEAFANLDLTPETLAVTACGPQEQQVELLSTGTAAIELLDLVIDGSGWSVEDIALPLSIPAGTTLAVAVTGSEGDATLTVVSDDPDQPEQIVALSAVADVAPAVRIDAPTDGAIFSSGELASLSGTVSDDVDATDALALVWASDVDGTLSTEPAVAGLTELSWAAETRTVGPHLLTLSATDSCGQESLATVEVCQDEGYTVDELDISSWHFEGVAQWSEADDWLELTRVGTDLVGTAFATDETVSGDAVDIAFRFYIGGGTGADGISLTVLDSSRSTTFLGGIGCGIGYGGDADCTAGPGLPGWSIEVDTYYNGGQDPTEEDHLMLTFDGDVDDPAVWAALPEMEDTGWHLMEVSVAAPHVTVAVDGVTYIEADLAGFTAFPGWVGFTAGTGGLTNQHLIDSLEVTAHTCE